MRSRNRLKGNLQYLIWRYRMIKRLTVRIDKKLCEQLEKKAGKNGVNKYINELIKKDLKGV